VIPCSVTALALALLGQEAAERALSETPASGAARALDPLEVLETPADDSPAAGRPARHPVPAVGEPLADSLRGVVLLDAGDHARCDRILAWGPRLATLRGDAVALAQHAFRARDEGFAARAAAHRGGFLVAGTGYGAGEPCEHAARVTAALGVKAVIAQSFAPRHARALALYGVLPLLWRSAPDDPPVRAGDELELVDLAETLAPSRPLSVRHLTLGGRFDVTHDMDSRTLDMVRAGGLLGACARAEAPVPEGWRQ
ncbi:MAG: hypothetical protein IT348_18990, partial [Candidatus Eisenbacteria bacterium]|nr:hypothetical protein [Candidatus Eisenbacteria bacterium]